MEFDNLHQGRMCPVLKRVLGRGCDSLCQCYREGESSRGLANQPCTSPWGITAPGDTSWTAVSVKLTGFCFSVVAFSVHIPAVAPAAIQFS